jgi:hypothetical protein
MCLYQFTRDVDAYEIRTSWVGFSSAADLHYVKEKDLDQAVRELQFSFPEVATVSRSDLSIYQKIGLRTW